MEQCNKSYLKKQFTVVRLKPQIHEVTNALSPKYAKFVVIIANFTTKMTFNMQYFQVGTPNNFFFIPSPVLGLF